MLGVDSHRGWMPVVAQQSIIEDRYGANALCSGMRATMTESGQLGGRENTHQPHGIGLKLSPTVIETPCAQGMDLEGIRALLSSLHAVLRQQGETNWRRGVAAALRALDERGERELR